MLSFLTTRSDDYERDYYSDAVDGYYYCAAPRLIHDFQTLTTFGGSVFFCDFHNFYDFYDFQVDKSWGFRFPTP